MNVKKVARSEPVVTAGLIVSAVGALINLSNGFGLTTIEPQQVEAINAAIVAMWPLLIIIRHVVWSPASVQALEDEAYQNGLDDAEAVTHGPV